jgi:hypothetical protein
MNTYLQKIAGNYLAGFVSNVLTALCCVTIALAQPGFSQNADQSSDGIWRRIGAGSAPQLLSVFGDETQPHSALVLNSQSLDQVLRSAPMEFSGEVKRNVEMSLPFPDGTFQKFRVEESPVSDVPLGSTGFQSHTFEGTGIDDPTATVRFETAFDGFHAVVRTASGVFYVDPSKGTAKTEAYFSYFASARSRSKDQLHCEVSEDQTKRDQRRKGLQERSSPRPQSFTRDGKQLKEYRLALAANSFYVDAVYNPHLTASKFDQAAAAIVRTVNRVNEIYAVDLGVRLTLVKDEAKLIFVDPTKDPYRTVNADAGKALDVNQKTIDSIIGDKNYDIGHLFTTKTSGLARLQVTCLSGAKAMGVTGLSTPSGDAFDVDYVAHEMGHQFGANHTFNGTSGSCNRNRNSSTAYEPGSGSTIMAYAGICDPESLQTHSDPYFHVASLLEITDYIGTGRGGDACGVTRANSSSTTPQIVLHGDFTIPKGTPFVLTANLLQQLPNESYTWEEFDLGDASPPNDEDKPNATARPLFRSVLPRANSSRYFPDSEYLFVTPPPIGEALPMLNRTLTFQVTGRDNHGGFSVAEQHVVVNSSSGPFRVLPFTGSRTWVRGSTHEIRWDVANTDKSPINCERLKVSLIIDGHVDSRMTLNDDVPNTGSVTLVIPEQAPLTTHGRLMLEANGNIFLAVSPDEIEIVRQ